MMPQGPELRFLTIGAGSLKLKPRIAQRKRRPVGVLPHRPPECRFGA